MDDLEVTTTQVESAIVLHAVGAVDSDTAPRLQEPLLRAVDSGVLGQFRANGRSKWTGPAYLASVHCIR